MVRDYDLETWQLTILTCAGEAMDRMKQAQSAIGEHGVVIPMADGSVKANPAVQCERDSRTALYGHLRGLGLDVVPTAAGKIGRPGKGVKG